MILIHMYSTWGNRSTARKTPSPEADTDSLKMPSEIHEIAHADAVIGKLRNMHLPHEVWCLSVQGDFRGKLNKETERLSLHRCRDRLGDWHTQLCMKPKPDCPSRFRPWGQVLNGGCQTPVLFLSQQDRERTVSALKGASVLSSEAHSHLDHAHF